MFVQANPFLLVKPFVHVNLLVSDICSSEPISYSNARSSNIVSANNIRPSETVSARNICLGKPVCNSHVRPSSSICGSMVCQSKPASDGNIRRRDLNTSNVLPSKPTGTSHFSFVNS